MCKRVNVLSVLQISGNLRACWEIYELIINDLGFWL